CSFSTARRASPNLDQPSVPILTGYYSQRKPEEIPAIALTPCTWLDCSFLPKEQTMSKAIVRFLAILGALWLIGMVIVMVAVIGTKGKVPSKTILEANFEEAFMEDVPETPTAQLLLTERQTLRDVVDAIDR